MKTYFEPRAQEELQARLQALEPGSPARWGRMDAAQMLAHCTEGIRMATGEVRVKAGFPALFGWMLKRLAYNDSPFRHGVPTARELRVVDARAFEVEKGRLQAGLQKAAQGPSVLGNHPHPFFGRLTDAQWGILLYKHLDHHFRQFGV